MSKSESGLAVPHPFKSRLSLNFKTFHEVMTPSRDINYFLFPYLPPRQTVQPFGLGFAQELPHDSHLDNVNWTRRAKLYLTELVNKAFSDSS